MSIEVLPVEGLPILHEGDNISEEVCKRAELKDGDVICVASSVYSKTKGYTRLLESIVPGERAKRIAEKTKEDPRFIQAVLDDTKELIIEYPFVLSKMESGHVGVRAGVDNSNIERGYIIRLPPDPMGCAEEIREEIKKISGAATRVIITDTCGRSFRRGQTGVAIGWAGMKAIRDFRGDCDLFGRVLEITEEAVVDEFAAFSNFLMGESNTGVPVVIFRNCPEWKGHDSLFFSPDEDITIKAMKKENKKE
ncbi:coenzyme F420-0:L-glutamate ligase/coenzyme F420-1:gamma-L-glutamate ligase [Methanomicrobium sp. W14]|uniref:coenzyme F420-0:L-glutamate ligase n=1 Tax=Methanomicrobium sp. W14 TaxID=2817839 RepID=UPI001AE9A022|nr:coenzyme F420-0:L-glutamate ligase [Methanomicrobium sp. W14]MBP2132331.1 coenzyme F420-0:L-glutamate ligase/coenzyme F420-1:gamma-L-glutamate ligase [Methanomicrobium sp. W14]